MTSTLYRNARVYSPAEPNATALLVTDGHIAWLGSADGDAPSAEATVDLDGALVTPAFVDAHVHATHTGIALAALDLAGVRSAAQLLDAVAAHVAALPPDAIVIGHGFDESTWVDTPPPHSAIDRAAGGRLAYLSQASMHSALTSTAMLVAGGAELRLAAGFDESGWLRRDAHHVARRLAFGSLTRPQRRDLQTAALRHAAAQGIAAIHECAGPQISSEADLDALLAGRGAGNGLPQVFAYWGELMGAVKARELGAVGAGGDLFADGALGARTAHLSEPYLDGPTAGHGYLSEDEVTAHVVDCVRHGVQAGFHAIGDVAIATVLAGFRAAAGIVGLDRLREGRHRVEHVEIADRAMIASLVEFGLVASVQPAFDRLWGGPAQMYAQRLGVDRSLASNPMGSMHGVGVALAFGSDSPVTPLDPWGSVRSAMHHFNPVQRISDQTAFAAHTRGGWRAVHRDDVGLLITGAPATFAAWDTPAGLTSRGLPVLAPDTPLPECRRTVLDGTPIFDRAANA